MFVSISFDEADGTASFVVGVAVVRCSSMDEAVALSQRVRAALQALARRGRRPRRMPDDQAVAIADWLDEIELDSLWMLAPAPDTPTPTHADFEARRGTERISDIG
jgi:hypothetical protein